MPLIFLADSGSAHEEVKESDQNMRSESDDVDRLDQQPAKDDRFVDVQIHTSTNSNTQTANQAHTVTS